MKCGPPMASWTGRFESKHRIAKNTAESSKNVVNISKTISERQQFRSVSVYYNGMFNTYPFILPDTVFKKSDLTDTTEFDKNLKMFMNDTDILCKSAFINNQAYKVGDLVVISLLDCDKMNVGDIRSILVRENKVYFVVEKYNAVRNDLQYFEAVSNDSAFHFVEPGKLADFKPLSKKGIKDKFLFTLHHFISFKYD